MIQQREDLTIDIKKDEDLNLIALAIGSLAPSSLVSIRSFLSIRPLNKLCIGVNSSSILSLKKSLQSREFERLCLHDLTDSFLNTMNFDINDIDRYHAYHSNGFSIVTLGKWLLIIDVFKLHKSKYVLYSDIDIFWKLSEPGKILLSSNTYVLTQDGWHPSKGEWYCTGIMFWENNNITRNILSKVVEVHIHGLKENKSLNDEVIFNSLFLNTEEGNRHISVLPRYEYLVGYHILNLRWLRSRKILEKCSAFHANSVEGEELKNLMLEVVQLASGSLRRFLQKCFLLNYEMQKRNLIRRFRQKREYFKKRMELVISE